MDIDERLGSASSLPSLMYANTCLDPYPQSLNDCNGARYTNGNRLTGCKLQQPLAKLVKSRLANLHSVTGATAEYSQILVEVHHFKVAGAPYGQCQLPAPQIEQPA